MVKRSRDQSQEAPRRFSWLTIVPPDSSFHSQTLDEFLAAERRGGPVCLLRQLALDHHLGGDAGMVGAGLPEHVACRACARSGTGCPAACC